MERQHNGDATDMRAPILDTESENSEDELPSFEVCVEEGNVEGVKEHLSRGVQEDVTYDFHCACEDGHTEIIKLLLARDDVNVTVGYRW
mmetsp:Transcript_5798/g.7147  ORF Transcript_5798/g.7147 Transcript_5798/m.7147 type:complete len:89 (+) Transcript_5798:184-450(+)